MEDEVVTEEERNIRRYYWKYKIHNHVHNILRLFDG